MPPQKGKGCGSAIGCVVVLAALGVAGWHFYPRISAFLRPGSAAIEWGNAHEGGGLRVRVLAAAVEPTVIRDALGSREGGLDLHVTLEITNMGDAPAIYRTPRLLGASEPRLRDDRGREVPQATYGDKATIEDQLEQGHVIAPHDRETHDLLFKVPAAGATSFLLNFDLATLGRQGVVQFRIPADQVKGLR